MSAPPRPDPAAAPAPASVSASAGGAAAARGSELLVISRLRAQLLASEAEVARLRAENAQLRHEALQRAVLASAVSRADAAVSAAAQSQSLSQGIDASSRQQVQQQQQVQVQVQPVSHHEINSSQCVALPAAPTAATDVTGAGTSTSTSNGAYTYTAPANRLRASSIAGVSALCSMKRRPSPPNNTEVDTAGEAENHALCLIPGCNEPSEGDRTSHLCRGHHGQFRSAASTAAAEAITNASANVSVNSDADTGADTGADAGADANDEKKPAPTEKTTPSLELPPIEIDLDGEKMTRTQKRLLESMMQEDAKSRNASKSAGSAAGGSTSRESKSRTKSSSKQRQKQKKNTSRPRGTSNGKLTAEPTRSTKRRITKPSQPGIGETKEGRGVDYNRIFIRQTLLETLRRVGTAVDPYGYFSYPVDPDEDDCPDYYDIVDRDTEAMDLSTIESMIKDGTVKSVDGMRAMLMRIVFSCRKYNRDEENEVREECEKILPLAEPMLDRARKTIEQQMKKSGSVGPEKGTANKSNSSTSSINNPRAKNRQRTDGIAAGGSSGGKRSGTKIPAAGHVLKKRKQGKHNATGAGEHGAHNSDIGFLNSVPTQVFDRPASDIGTGWRIIGIQRNRGKYPDHIDRYWISPKAKKSLRSRKEVDRFLVALEKTEGSEEDAFRITRR